MTTLTNDAARHVARNRTSQVAAFSVEFDDWNTVAGDWDGAYRRGQATIFQHGKWLAAWYGAFAGQPGIEPLLATVRDRATGEVALFLPLIRRKLKRICVVEFADLELTDYNAPLLGPAAPREPQGGSHPVARAAAGVAPAAWRRRSHSLQENAARSAGRVQSAGDAGWSRAVLAERKSRHHRRGFRSVQAFAQARRPQGSRTELARVYGVSRRCIPDCRRERTKRLRVLATLDAQQSARMQHLGANFILDDEACADFYRNLVRDGLGEAMPWCRR